MPTEQEVIAAVKRYAYNRYRHLTPRNVPGMNEEEVERVTTTNGYLDYIVEDVQITEHEGDTWYVEATLWFQTGEEPIECGTDIYKVCLTEDGSLEVDWHG